MTEYEYKTVKNNLQVRKIGFKRWYIKCINKDCNKAARAPTNLCKSHNGGRRCKIIDCNTGARDSFDFCIKHGGFKRCKIDNCNTASRDGYDYCILHGGGKRCSRDGFMRVGHCIESLCRIHIRSQICIETDCKSLVKIGSNFCNKHLKNFEKNSIPEKFNTVFDNIQIEKKECKTDDCSNLIMDDNEYCMICSFNNNF